MLKAQPDLVNFYILSQIYFKLCDSPKLEAKVFKILNMPLYTLNVNLKFQKFAISFPLYLIPSYILRVLFIGTLYVYQSENYASL